MNWKLLGKAAMMTFTGAALAASLLGAAVCWAEFTMHHFGGNSAMGTAVYFAPFVIAVFALGMRCAYGYLKRKAERAGIEWQP